MAGIAEQLDPIMVDVRAVFASKHSARETALRSCREALRDSANAIRAIHRGEFPQAEELIEHARELLSKAADALREHRDTYHAGFVNDAQKEYVEACSTLAIVAGRPLPGPEELRVELPAYLNGLGETVGELRRHLLDKLRAGEVEQCEAVLTAMDDIYGALFTMDYPDAMTAGLRRNTDAARGILERTRGDLTVALRQQELQRRLAQFEERLK